MARAARISPPGTPMQKMPTTSRIVAMTNPVTAMPIGFIRLGQSTCPSTMETFWRSSSRLARFSLRATVGPPGLSRQTPILETGGRSGNPVWSRPGLFLLAQVVRVLVVGLARLAGRQQVEHLHELLGRLHGDLLVLDVDGEQVPVAAPDPEDLVADGVGGLGEVV